MDVTVWVVRVVTVWVGVVLAVGVAAAGVAAAGVAAAVLLRRLPRPRQQLRAATRTVRPGATC